MGDTGSLSMGAAIGVMAILLKAEFLLVIVGGVFVLEALSVIIQTTYFRYTARTSGQGAEDLQDVSPPSPFRTDRLVRDKDCDPLLDRRNPVRDARDEHAQDSVIRGVGLRQRPELKCGWVGAVRAKRSETK